MEKWRSECSRISNMKEKWRVRKGFLRLYKVEAAKIITSHTC